MDGTLPEDFAATARDYVAKLQAEPAKIASRKASQNALNAYGPHLPELLGGSADLAPSNLTIWSGSTSIKDDPAGNYIHYGVREFGMTAVANGIALHGGFIPYTSTFLMFVEYARNAARMAALMKARQIMVYTHDSIGLGEDGPTHQAVEQLASLRLTPNFSTWRPCDQVETASRLAGGHCAPERTNGADPVAAKPGADAAHPGTGAGYCPGRLRAERCRREARPDPHRHRLGSGDHCAGRRKTVGERGECAGRLAPFHRCV
ncbi:hypothetical protein LNP17_22985 [Klebsiella variicola subsp. variicola]|nr:hypothetical protein [Klebsiella variicola subsp. variicola]